MRTEQRLLVLADGSHWLIVAGDEEATPVVSHLGDAMRLSVPSDSASSVPPHHGLGRRLVVRVDAHHSKRNPAAGFAPVTLGGEGVVVCVLRSFIHSDGLYVQLVDLSLVLARDAQTRGGVLLHGALAERDGIGVILAAPGGTGKTTASRRLPAPWRSRCDDTTLVVRDSHGNYWAHPWPTWSRFLEGEAGGTWDVQKGVPLKGIFFLSQAAEGRVESVGPGHALGLLLECANQASHLMEQDSSQERTRALRLERFHNLCAVATVIPAHILHLSLAGTFWQQIEQML